MSRACVDGQYLTVNSSGELTVVPGSMGLRQVLVFGNAGTYQFKKASYPWLAHVRIRVQAAGGGSAGCQAAANQLACQPGAAGGGYSESFLPVSALGATESIVVGAGGTAGTPTTDGGPGGNSSFGGLVTANGGPGGSSPMNSGTFPQCFSGTQAAAAGLGQITMGGGAGGGAIRLAGNQGLAGQGGESFFGHGGFPRAANGGGTSSRGFGGGASGSLAWNNASVNGMVGGGGLVVVELYA